MFREIRRKDNEIPVEEAVELLKAARRGVLAVNGDDGYPYAVPVNYLYDAEKNRIYIHGARAGHKFDSLSRDGRVCFTVCGEPEIRDVDWAPYVKSAVVFGRCSMVGEPEEAAERIKSFAMKYYPAEEIADETLKRSGSRAMLFVIDIEHISGKEVQEK